MPDIYIHSIRIGANAHLAAEAPSSLSAEELARADRFKVEHARQNFLVSHHLLRQTLSGYLQSDARSIRYRYGQHGKPVLDAEDRCELHFNLSHSGDRLLIAVCHDHEIGVDIERIQQRSDPLQLARHFMSSDEASALAKMRDPVARREFFFTLWTRKEAFVKSLGRGFFHALNETGMLEISAGVHVPSSVELRAYRIIDLEIAVGYKAAVAILTKDDSETGAVEIHLLEQ